MQRNRFVIADGRVNGGCRGCRDDDDGDDDGDDGDEKNGCSPRDCDMGADSGSWGSGVMAMTRWWSPTRRKRNVSGTCLGLIRLMTLIFVSGNAGKPDCPPADSTPGCPCYKLDDGLFLECAGTNDESIRAALVSVVHAAGRKLIYWQI